MKIKLFKLFVIVSALALVLSACGVLQGSAAVEVPPQLKAAIHAAVLFVVVAGIKFILDLFGLDLSAFGVAIAAAIGDFLIFQLQLLINAIPAQFDPLVNIALLVLLAILTAIGFVWARKVGFRVR